MRGKFKDLTGSKFTRLYVKSRVNFVSPVEYLCICDCGNIKQILSSSLSRGQTKSCGCLMRELTSNRGTRHGKHKSAEYQTWQGMKSRCCNPNAANYARYGGKGVTVCEKWINSFEQFFTDMGEKPSYEYSLDRIDNAKGYSKENCHWATPKEQNENKNLWHSTITGRFVKAPLEGE